MKAWKRLLPILLVIAVVGCIGWYLLVYDTAFTKDVLVSQAQAFERSGNHVMATWLYDVAYLQSGKNEKVAIELAEAYKENGNYSKAEYTLSNAIAAGGSPELYMALSKTYVEQNKLLDAVTMLDNVKGDMKTQLDAVRPAIPVATPDAGFYSQYMEVSIAAETGTLYVSVDGEYPSVPEDEYKGSITLAGGETTIYAVTVGENGLVSPLAIFGYTVHGVIEEVELANAPLSDLVYQKLDKAAGEKLMSSDLWQIAELNMPASITDYSDLKFFPYLKKLTIEAGQYENLQALSALVSLEELVITNSNVTAEDLSVIAGLPRLKNLTLSNCTLADISNLSGAKKLETLILSKNAIRNLTALTGMTNLKKLDLSQNALQDVSLLAALTQLEELDISYNSLTGVAPLAACTELKGLNASQNMISDLTGISELAQLTKLYLDHNALASVEALANNTALVELSLSQNSLTDISALTGLAKMQYLNVSNNKLTTLPKWAGGCALVKLDAANNQITSVAPLGGLVNLNTVLLANNKISSVDDLAKCTNLFQVDVTKNPVRNVSKLLARDITVHYDVV